MISVVCDYDFEIGKDIISRTLLQVEYERSDRVCDFLGTRGWITGKLRLQWERIQEKWRWRIDGKTLCVDLEEESGFVGPVWSRSIDMVFEEEVEHVLQAAPIAVVVGAMEL